MSHMEQSRRGSSTGSTRSGASEMTGCAHVVEAGGK